MAPVTGGTAIESWSALELASEPVLSRASDDVRWCFGLGPAGTGRPAEARAQNLLEALRPGLRALRWGRQVHGRVVASLASEPARPLAGAACVGRCDALITAETGLGLLVWTADCVPVLMSGGGVVAAVHAGWRGTAADIVGAVVDRFRTEYGVAPDGLHAALGPAISGPAYPVGDEVIEALGGFGIAEASWRDGNHVDLRSFLAARLEALGLRRERVESIGPCTASTPGLASFRRDGAAAGRQWSLVYRTG